MTRNILNVVAVQVGWFACVLGAASGAPLLGPIVVALLLALHLSWTPRRWQEAMLLSAAGALGYLADSVLVLAGLMSFEPHTRWGGPSPFWMVALWMNFASTLHVSMRWLLGRYFTAALLGALAGPLVYLAGDRLGAVLLHPNLARSLPAVALEWLLVMPLLLLLAHWTAISRPAETPNAVAADRSTEEVR